MIVAVLIPIGALPSAIADAVRCAPVSRKSCPAALTSASDMFGSNPMVWIDSRVAAKIAS